MKSKPEGWVRVELHLHTCASRDSLVPVARLIERCNHLGIDRFAVTDHNVFEGALTAQALAPGRVILGEEIETTQGELIAYFMTERVPPGLEPHQAIERLQEQGALISVPHPFDTVREPHWKEADLRAIAPSVHAIETFNARCFTNHPNLRAKAFAQQFGLLETVGSDAHSLPEIGFATMWMPHFEDAPGFRAALRQAVPETRLSPAYVHLFSRFAVFWKRIQRLRGLSLV